MSILTKVLIVLLSFASLFLGGMVITYVGTAENYKAKFEEKQGLVKTIQAEKATSDRIAEEKTQLVAEKIREYEELLQELREENIQLTDDLKNAEHMSLNHQRRADRWQGQLQGFGVELANLRMLLELTQTELDKARTQGVKESKELGEITASLYERIVQIQALEADKKRVVEEKQELEDKVRQLSQVSVTAPKAQAVTPERSDVQAASPTAPSGLNGLVSGVSQNLAIISLGSADGVKKSMVFHVTRGSDFICDIVITDVDVNKSAGVLELIEKQPKVGDNASTKLL